MKKIFSVILLVLIGGLAGYMVFDALKPDFKNLSASEMYERIVEERDFAIGQAVAVGDFRCCINPPCTMCYMEANKWNNQTAGTCACDDLIAKGEEACPQCRRGLEQIHSEDDSFCDIEALVPTCGSASE